MSELERLANSLESWASLVASGYEVPAAAQCMYDAARALRRIARPAPAAQALTHTYEPDSKYPWFCGQCGYPEHERLKHTPRDLGHSTLPEQLPEDGITIGEEG